MVVDASALVAVFKVEPTATQVENAIRKAQSLVMASVTLTEVLLAGLKAGIANPDTLALVRGFDIQIVPVDEALAVVSAEARHRFPIRFGDAFVYALAKARSLPILTLDAEFAKTDATLVPLTPAS